MVLGISETQFVFTYLHHYLNLPTKRNIKFVLPTLGKEGDPSSPYAGSDLIISGHIYIQFKLSDYLMHWGAKEITSNLLPQTYKPYFRFFIKNAPTAGGMGQYDLLVNRARASPANVVKYVSPVFDNSTYSPSCVSANFWYNSFFSFNPKLALYGFIVETNILRVLSSGVTIGADNSHRVCYNYSDIIANRNCHIFSDEGRIQAQIGVLEYNFNSENFELPIEGATSIENELNILSELTRYPREITSLSISNMQSFLIRKYDIFWIPFGTIYN